MHLVAFDEAIVLFVNSGRSGGEGQNVFIQIPAQIFIKYGGQEMELVIVVFLCKKNAKKMKVIHSVVTFGPRKHCKVSNYNYYFRTVKS